MKDARNTKRIIEVLDLLNNEQRTSTIRSYITYIVSSLTEASLKEIIDFTQVEFELNLERVEVSESATALVIDGQLVLIGEKYKLTESAQISIATRVAVSDEQEEKLKSNFYRNISSLSDSELSQEDFEKLFKEFKGYIHENFFYYGKSAISLLGRNEQKDKNLTAQQVFKIFSNNLPAKLRKVFFAYIENIAQYSTLEDLDYYESLADRAEQFFALGLSKELAIELASTQKIDWHIFVDTNFLLSALKIRANTMNSAVDSLFKIINENTDYFSIKLSYLKSTYRELRQFKPVLNKLVVNQKLTDNQIKAALQSGNVDSFTESFYEKQLIHGQATQHPGTIIDQAATILKSKKLELYNTDIKEIDLESDSFRDAMSDYGRYNSIMTEARMEKNLTGEVRYKDPDQIEHDIYLREAILTLRSRATSDAVIHFQDCKIFGLTLDFGLIDYDKYAGRRDYGQEFYMPAFFTPTYLLKKLNKLLPVPSEDYRKSFLSSIASPVFSGSEDKSQVAQSALSVFHAIGIDDLEFITKSLTSQLFLNEIKDVVGDIEKATQFVENELSKEITQRAQKEKRLTRTLKTKEAELNQVSEAHNSVLESKTNLEDKTTLLEHQVEALTKGLKANKKSQDKLQALLAKLSNQQPSQQSIPFTNEQDRQRIQELEQKVKQQDDAEALRRKQQADEEARETKRSKDLARDNFIENEVKTWQRASVKKLVIALILLTIVIGTLLVIHHGSVNQLITHAENIKGDHAIGFIAPSLLAIAVFVFNIIFIQDLVARHKNPSAIKAYRDLLKIPEHLK